MIEKSPPNVLVIGGSAGIGLAIAEEFARHGSDLLLVARDVERLDRASLHLQKFGVRSDTIAMDATAPGAEERLATALKSRSFVPRYVIICVGRWLAGSATDVTGQHLRAIMDENVVAQHALVRALLGQLKPGGGMLFVGSLAGCLPVPMLGGYGASKAALASNVLALRQEIAGRGIKICILKPGLVATSFLPRPDHKYLGLLMDLLSSNPATVARAAYRGLVADVPVIVPGIFWRIVWLGLRLAPAPLVTLITRQVMRRIAQLSGATRTRVD